MKNLIYLFAIFFVIAIVSSCSKEDDKDLINMGLKKSAPAPVVNYNPDGPDVTPVGIDGANRGGNVTCDEVAAYFEGITFCDCGEKVDVEWDEYGNVIFEGEFPAGIEITNIEEKSFDFEMINSPGSCYKVGAVIVKGGNGAQVYFYGEDGILIDNGLMAPDMKGVSNITFCMVECEVPDLVIALKSQTNGGPVWTVVDGYTDKLVAYYPFVTGFNGKVYVDGDLSQSFGNINVSDSDGDGLLEVSIDNSDMPTLKFVYQSHLFVGTLEDYLSAITFQDYPYSKDVGFEGTIKLVYDLPF